MAHFDLVLDNPDLLLGPNYSGSEKCFQKLTPENLLIWYALSLLLCSIYLDVSSGYSYILALS